MPEQACAGGIAVVIDVLRASTTIITALANGAKQVKTVRSLETAHSLAGSDTLLGGERGGHKPALFHFGNSPYEYTRENVSGQMIVFSTTNGTAALHACESASEILIGGIINRSAVALNSYRLSKQLNDCDIHLVCAGTDGKITEEDLLGAGAILDAALQLDGVSSDMFDVSAQEALDLFQSTVLRNPEMREALLQKIIDSRGGRNLAAIGMEQDLMPAAAIDSSNVVPKMSPASGALISAYE